MVDQSVFRDHPPWIGIEKRRRIFLVLQNRGCIHIYGKFVPEQSGHMPQRVYGKTWRPVAQAVGDQLFVDDCIEGQDA